MKETIPQNTAEVFIRCNKIWDQKESKEKKGMMRAFCTIFSLDIGKTDEKWMGCSITSHCRNCGLV